MAESRVRRAVVATLVALAFVSLARIVCAQQSSIRIQCPSDTNGDGRVTAAEAAARPDVVCRHLTAGDGFVRMADGKTLYTFGFSDIPLTVNDPNQVMDLGTLAANLPAPLISLTEGQDLYLTLSNVGMVMRPDLGDAHSVHWHGFPQASAVFDGVPESSITINMGASMTYYYKAQDPGTYMYHCHVEATEHMQMGMVGSLHVYPRQDRCGTAGRPACPPGVTAGLRYAYNDGDGSTRFDVEVPILMSSFDPTFHDLHFHVQPLPFADMRDQYFLLNGRGYPDTVAIGAFAGPTVDPDGAPLDGKPAQPVTSRIVATVGQRILLRIANLSVTDYATIGTIGIPMRVIARDARLLQGGDGTKQYYATNSVTLGGGESADVILDTAGLTSGRYFLYSTNLHRLANAAENFGGQMTEIRVN